MPQRKMQEKGKQVKKLSKSLQLEQKRQNTSHNDETASQTVKFNVRRFSEDMLINDVFSS